MNDPEKILFDLAEKFYSEIISAEYFVKNFENIYTFELDEPDKKNNLKLLDIYNLVVWHSSNEDDYTYSSRFIATTDLRNRIKAIMGWR